MKPLVTGRGLIEGPRWDARDGSVWFTDALGGGIFRREASGEVRVVVPERRGVGGLALHADGGAVGSGRDLVHAREDGVRPLLSADGITGFNDLHVDAEGRLLAGALRYRPLKGEEPVPGAVWRVGPRGAAEELFGGVIWPNGIGVSPAGDTVYVSDYARECVLVWPGEGEPQVFAGAPQGASCDGLAVDRDGGVWVALGAGGGVMRLRADGEREERLDVPADFVSSVSFGGEDGRDLYIATIGTLFVTRAPVPGLPCPLARV